MSYRVPHTGPGPPSHMSDDSANMNSPPFQGGRGGRGSRGRSGRGGRSPMRGGVRQPWHRGDPVSPGPGPGGSSTLSPNATAFSTDNMRSPLHDNMNNMSSNSNKSNIRANAPGFVPRGFSTGASPFKLDDESFGPAVNNNNNSNNNNSNNNNSDRGNSGLFAGSAEFIPSNYNNSSTSSSTSSSSSTASSFSAAAPAFRPTSNSYDNSNIKMGNYGGGGLWTPSNNNSNSGNSNSYDEKKSAPRRHKPKLQNNGSLTVNSTPSDPSVRYVSMLSLLYDPPVENCQLRPYVAITNPDGKVNALRNKDSDQAVYRWSRGTKRLCSAPKCRNNATMQCLSCAKGNIPENVSLFCSKACYKMLWPKHRQFHQAHPLVSRNHEGKLVPHKGKQEWNTEDDEAYYAPDPNAPEALCAKYPPPVGNEYTQICTERCYTPTADDVGCVLKLECAPVLEHDSSGQVSKIGDWVVLNTSAVIPIPEQADTRDTVYRQPDPIQPTAGHPFKVVCFNVLAQTYATRHMYPYCAVWALEWNYRKKALLRTILSHNADVICLQEVQGNHFEKFFLPNLSKAGFDGIFKRKTRDDTPHMDGCAIFYRRDRFALNEQYGIEYNEAARQQINDGKSLRRLLRGNIALVVVLEEIMSGGNDNRRRKRHLCVANTHIYWDPELSDVKLWQTWILLQELEKLVLQRRNLPLVLCGDFNSMPDSSVYQLLTNQAVHPSHTDLAHDPCGILPSAMNLTHNLPLQSAYSSLMGEPAWSNYTGHFVGVLDYILFSKNHMTATSCLDVGDEHIYKENTALPSPQFPSDHIALVAELDWNLDKM